MRTESPFAASEPESLRIRREHLRQQQSTWFAWVCRLHELHSRLQTPESATVLGIAQRRWAQAQEALQRAESEPVVDPFRAPPEGVEASKPS